MALRDLVTDVNGSTSHTKIWASIAYGIATYKFAITPNLDADIWLVYLGVVGGAALASKLISYKFGGANAKED